MFFSNYNFTPNDLLEMSNRSSPEIVNYISNFVEQNDFEFYIYKLNLFKAIKDNIKISDFLKIMEFNLSQIEILDEGDIISKFASVIIFLHALRVFLLIKIK